MEAYKKAGKTGGGYWFKQAPPKGEEKKLQDMTTYRAEVQEGAQTLSDQLTRVAGLSSTLSGYEAARR